MSDTRRFFERRSGCGRFFLRSWPLAVLLLLLTPDVTPAPVGDAQPRRAPRLPKSGWLNTADNKPLRLEELRGKVVLVEFWAFACFNCRNTLPYVRAWHEKYARQGLVVIGVHTPELDFERKLENVKKAVAELGITYPVVLDNDYACWQRYENLYWPTIYLIDPAGRISYVAIGEGNYERTEARIRALLEQATRPGN